MRKFFFAALAAASSVLAPTAGFAYSLTAQPAVSIGSWPDAVAIGDVTGDGRNDVVVVTPFSLDALNDYQVFVFAQQPDGSLAAPSRFPYLPSAHTSDNGLALADLNNDGVKDVVVGHAGGISILLADGNGGLAAPVVINGDGAFAVVADDVNHDGKMDIIGLNFSATATEFLGNGAGGVLATRTIVSNNAGYGDFELGDFNRDGLRDLAIMSGQGLGPNLSIHRADGVGGYSAPTTYRVPGGDLTGGVALGDFNHDGRLDFALTQRGSSLGSIWLYLQGATGAMNSPTWVPSYNSPAGVEAADLNGDGLDDLVVLHDGFHQLGFYLQSGGSLQSEVLVSVETAGFQGPDAMAVGDINGDACNDVVIAGDFGGILRVLGQFCADVTPNPFAFTDLNGVVRGSEQISNAIAVSGIDTPAQISVVGGEYSVNGGSFTSNSSTVTVGAAVRVRHFAAAGFSTSVSTSLTIGGVSDTFTTTTEAIDTTPAAFAFASQANLATAIAVASAPIVVSGINAPAVISISGGDYSVNGGAFSASLGSVVAGDQVSLRVTTASTANTAATATLVIGGVPGAFSATTGAIDTTPEPFAFFDATFRLNQRPTPVTSNTITVSGINALVPIMVSGGGVKYSKNGSRFTATAGTVSAGDQVSLQMTPSAVPNASVDSTVTIGGVSDIWSVTSTN